MSAMMALAGKRVVVMGLGRFGGGVGVARFCAEQDARVLVTDQLDESALAESIAQLADLPIEYRLGEHREEDFRAADLIVVNPAVDRRNNRYVQAAIDAGVELTSEIRLLVERLPNRGRTIGVTGTAGKSTTVAMIKHILDRAPGVTAWLGGNIGGSLLPDLPRIADSDWVVLELSSFMLEDLAEIRWSPQIAAVTNFAPNHLGRHGTFDAYRRAKQQIFDHQQGGAYSIAVLGPSCRQWFTTHCPWVVVVEQGDVEQRPVDLAIPGVHNQINAHLAASVTQAITYRDVAGPRREHIPESPVPAFNDLESGFGWSLEALSDFPGLAHRLQFVAQLDGIRYFNDSKSTTPESAMLAIDSFDPQIVHVILGGYDKQADLTELAQHAAERCMGIYTIGKTGNAIADAASKFVEFEGHHCHVERCETLNVAVAHAKRNAAAGQVILLSPGCASWDQFANFEQRGRRFIERVGL
jgi:UDP-N-acetylmuramoylalanine--D-glutamate ligase